MCADKRYSNLHLASLAKILTTTFVAMVMLASCSSGGSGGGDGGDDASTPYKAATSIYTGDTYTDAEVSVDANGDSIVRTKLVILFKPSATQEQVDDLFARINATITASIAGARSVSIRIPDPGNTAGLPELEAIIADIESETFVEAVLKSVVPVQSAVPENIDVTTGDFEFIRHHAAVGGTAAWNARNAALNTPSTMVLDFFGAGTGSVSGYLDASITGTVSSGHSMQDDHGYHVAGIIAGSYGGDSTVGGRVTGMLPVTTNLDLIDFLIAPDQRLGEYDAQVLILNRAAEQNTTVVLNTSLRYHCQSSTTSNTCREKADMMKQSIVWVDLVRAADMESRLFHATIAGNRGDPAPLMRDTETQHYFSGAATMTDMMTADGVAVPPLTNTMVVERVRGTGSPRRVECLSDNSFVGGNISAIGTNVRSLSASGTSLIFSGTSMAAPQVAGLAAYMLAIDNTLTPQDIKEILIETSAPVPSGPDYCSDWLSPAPVIDAYAAVLALDQSSALSGSPGDAPVRMAILDISNNGTDIGSNGVFNEYDLMYFIQEFDTGTQEKDIGIENVKYSRADLNGDGYDGGRDGYKRKFNLDIDYPPTHSTVTQNIEGNIRDFDEYLLSDDDILCYYAYSSLYTGSTTERTNLLGSRCNGSKVAIYYEHTNELVFPPGELSCNTTSYDAFDQRSTYDTRPLYYPSTDPIAERPSTHFWSPGDSNVDQTILSNTITRFAFDPGGSINNCSIQTSYSAASEIDSSITLNQAGDTINVNLSTTATSECVVPFGSTVDDPWSCATAHTMSIFAADYDFKISAATTLNLNINMVCTGPGLRLPGSTSATLGPEIGYFVRRMNAAGDPIPTNRDPSRRIIAFPIDCYDGSPTVNVQQLIELDAPENPGDIERVIVVMYGQIGAYGNWGNEVDPSPTLGELTNTTTMQGTVQLVPAY